MNPSVGTFISMDSYSGSIDDPVSLHKYLYANANPVSNSDPSGYSTLADLNASMGIHGILSNIATPNGKALFDAVMGVFGFASDVISTIKDGKEQGLSAEEIAANVAAGLLTSFVTNFSYLITSFYLPVGYILMVVAALDVINNLKEKQERVVSQIQVSPYDVRHGNLPYLKISTSSNNKTILVAL